MKRLFAIVALLIIVVIIGLLVAQCVHAGPKGKGKGPRHPTPSPDPCTLTDTCGPGDHGLGNPTNGSQHANCNAQQGEVDPMCPTPTPPTPTPTPTVVVPTPTPTVVAPTPTPKPRTSNVTCQIEATGLTPELSSAPVHNARRFELNLIAEAHYYLKVQVPPGTYWLLFWTQALGHSGQYHKFTCKAGESYYFVETPTLSFD